MGPARAGTGAARAALPASALSRLVAAVLDGLLVMLGELLLAVPILLYWWSHEAPREPAAVPLLPILLSILLGGLGLLLGALYFVYFWGVQGATPGKQIMGLVVQDQAGHWPIGVGPALLRVLGYGISLALLGVGFLLVPLTGYGLHDRLAGTRVVRAGDE